MAMMDSRYCQLIAFPSANDVGLFFYCLHWRPTIAVLNSVIIVYFLLVCEVYSVQLVLSVQVRIHGSLW